MQLKNLLNNTLSLLALSLTIGTTAAIAATPYVDSVKGRVELKRKNASDEGFRVITRGPVSLSSGDQLKISPGAIAKVVCPGQNAIVEKRGTGERLSTQKICPTWRAVIDKGAPPIGEMGGKDAQIPYLISPRRSLILTSTPTLRWNPVAGATQYTVQIKNAQGIVWQTQVKTSQVTYPGTPALTPSILYTVIIKTNTGKSSESEFGSQFLLLRSAELKTVQAETNLITQIDASPEIKALRLADYYASYQLPEPTVYGLTEKTVKDYSLSANAIDTLETLLKISKPTPLIYRKLGTLYTNIGVTLPAEQAYLKAIDSIQSPEDLEEWTLTAVALGELYELAQERKQAIGWYQQARAGFIFLSDKRAETLIYRIEKLKMVL
jgi:hypothetical protein